MQQFFVGRKYKTGTIARMSTMYDTAEDAEAVRQRYLRSAPAPSSRHYDLVVATIDRQEYKAVEATLGSRAESTER